MEIKPIYRIFAALISSIPPRKTINDVPENIREGVQYVLDTECGLIVGKRRNITQVPAHLQEFVLEDLASLGLDGYGNPLIQE